MPICRLARGMMSDGADGRLPWWKALFLRSHLWICGPCRRVDASLHRTLDLLGELGRRSTDDAGPPSGEEGGLQEPGSGQDRETTDGHR
ncbi:MAG: zf-HC2 domain-containing protein [Deltaproteobacteria bacterium]|nr:zf-HC2 domain-containing protein [Deltaproteobacteria bacterium]